MEELVLFRYVMKLICAIFLINLLLWGQSSSQVVVSIPDSKGKSDSTVYIPVKVDLKNYGVISYAFEILFDSNVLIANGVSTEGTLSEIWPEPVINTNFIDKMIVGAYFVGDTIKGRGNLINLVFQIKGNEGDSTEIRFSDFSFNNNFPSVYKIGGIFKVEQTTSSVARIDKINTPDVMIVYPNYPDPFVSSTTISYRLTKSEHVKVDVFNLLGKKIRTLVNEKQTSSVYSFKWDGKDDFGNTVTTGLYFYVVQSNKFYLIEKMIFIK